MYILHIANKNYSSWSLRPWVLLSTRTIPFTEQLTPFLEGSNWEPFRAFSPSGTVPCLIDGDRAVWDSLAIVEYLAERHAGVWPAADAARAWARCAAAEMHSGFATLRNHCPMNCAVTVRLFDVPSALQHDLARIDELWNEGLNRFGGPFLAGPEFTGVDAFYAPVVFRVLSYDLPLSDTSRRYAERMRALPAMQSWYTDAIAEPWLEKSHEAEIAAVGEVTEDRRSVALN